MNYTDQIGHNFTLTTPPKRIISIVPSQTELLFDLGLEKEVVGITKFCVYPQQWFKNKKRVGGTKNLNLDKISALKPDLIIANKEENTQEQIELLQKFYPVYTSDISTLEESLNMITDLGIITEKPAAATSLLAKIKDGFTCLEKNKIKKEISVLYLIWQDPFMSVGRDTFINGMLLRCGFKNVLINEGRYPEVNTEKIKELNPGCIFLSSEPYPFKEKHIQTIQKIVPEAKILLVDGELFSWYGSRLIYSSQYFIDLVNNLT